MLRTMRGAPQGSGIRESGGNPARRQSPRRIREATALLNELVVGSPAYFVAQNLLGLLRPAGPDFFRHPRREWPLPIRFPPQLPLSLHHARGFRDSGLLSRSPIASPDSRQ